MNVFKAVKENVTARQAAEMYGLKVTPKGMACCPFHQDRTPSMKIDRRYYCFGCGATGDAVDLTAQLLGLEPKDAVNRIASDFGIAVDESASAVTGKKKKASKPRADPQKEAEEWISQAVKTLSDYRWLLRDFEEYDAPKSMDEDWDDHPLFCLALQQKSYIDYLLDELMECSKDQFMEMKNSCGKEVEKIAERLSRYESGREKDDGGTADGGCKKGRGRTTGLVRRKESR